MNSDEIYKKRITKLRKKLDKIDEKMIKIMVKRFSVTTRIGWLKAEYDKSELDPNRELAQIKNYEMLAIKKNLSKNLVDGLHKLITDEVKKQHVYIKEIYAQSEDSNKADEFVKYDETQTIKNIKIND
ncbi:MAG: chorismate mutase [Bifidobacteriaceae bacterium]|jgi:chorismate mutase|nr:chorismate mutase [Bifidobacteriaceae bacterium]